MECKKCYVFSGLGMVRREDGAIQDDGDDAEMGGSVQGFKCSVGLGGALFSEKKNYALCYKDH